jgi:hypothetical protein
MISTALIFASSCAGLTRASIENMLQLNMMDCRVKPGNDDVEAALLLIFRIAQKPTFWQRVLGKYRC